VQIERTNQKRKVEVLGSFGADPKTSKDQVISNKGKQPGIPSSSAHQVQKSPKSVLTASTLSNAIPSARAKCSGSPSSIQKSKPETATATATATATSTNSVKSKSQPDAKKSNSGTTSHQGAPRQCPEALINSTQTVTAPRRELDEAIFRLAAASPIPISPIVERQFYESQLLLYVLGQARGGHKKRQNYHGGIDQDETELRRSFIDKLAYICDFKKRGSTVTALALQKTYQGVIFWLAANETVQPSVVDFLRQVLRLLKKVEFEASRKSTETQLLALIVLFNKERLDYYWSTLLKYLPLCIERLEELEGFTSELLFKTTSILAIFSCNLWFLTYADSNPTPEEIKSLKGLLMDLPPLPEERIDLVKQCFQARNSQAFDTLAQLTTRGKPHNIFFEETRHLLGRLGEHVKATKTIVSAALRFPGILDEYNIQVCVSPPSRCFFQSQHSITLNGMAGRIFTDEDDIIHYQKALETLEQISDGALLGRLQQECFFKTRVHAELLLVDLFYWHQLEFLDDDPYIGCSKPACFNCFQYILAHPGNFVLPACHNKLYLAWRTPDTPERDVSTSTLTRIREEMTRKINMSIRAELRRQLNGRYVRKASHHDSVTGTSSFSQSSAGTPSQTSKSMHDEEFWEIL
jgi:hypothetical protein